MGRSAKQLDLPEPWSSPLRDGAATVLGLISRNPALAGGATAFLVALSFVSANALWYQPYAHPGAFFATREFARPAGFGPEAETTTIRIVRPTAAPAPATSDPAVEEVQATLKELNFYAGEVDGIVGPATRKAIEAYQSKMGMTVTGKVDDDLLDQLGAAPITAGIVPSPAPRETLVTTADEDIPAQQARQPGERIIRIQAGLKAFGNDDIEIDGVMGARTQAAIREFQALFGLPETGEADEASYAKMKEIGLTN
jgi:peptidoglycan hydrolase-like protein with peptidoglycan-binding domain